MSAPYEQQLRKERFAMTHPEWSVHILDGATRFLAERVDSGGCRVVARPSLKGLLNRLDEIEAER